MYNQAHRHVSELKCSVCDRRAVIEEHWKCSVCANFYLCLSCYEFNNFFHDYKHSFLRAIQTASIPDDNSGLYKQVAAGVSIQQQKTNEGVSRDPFKCEICTECPIQGKIWKCDTCVDHCLCSSCYEIFKLTSFVVKCNSFTEMETPIIKPVFFPANGTSSGGIQQVTPLKDVSRDRLKCDICTECPIQGDVWKCDTCVEHCVCSSCYDAYFKTSFLDCNSFTKMKSFNTKPVFYPAEGTFSGGIQPDPSSKGIHLPDPSSKGNQIATNNTGSSGDDQHVIPSNLHRGYQQQTLTNQPFTHSSINLSISSDINHTDVAKPKRQSERPEITNQKRKKQSLHARLGFGKRSQGKAKSKVVKESFQAPIASVPALRNMDFNSIERPMEIETFTGKAASTEGKICEQDDAFSGSEQTDLESALQMDDASSNFLCLEHIHGNCNQSNCTRLHSKYFLPHLWQVKLLGDWSTMKDSESVEKDFCTPEKRSHYCVEHILRPRSLKVKFEQVITASAYNPIMNRDHHLEVRRLTTMSFKEAGDIADSYVTQWRWYWRDNDRRWELFKPDSLQHTLEAKFLAKQPAYQYSRENYKWEYVIDFNLMTQTNMITGTVRELRRRPLFVSKRDVQNKTTPPCLAPPQVIDVELPPTWAPWDVAHPFELVRLSQTDKEFIEVANNFFKTASSRFILAAVFRVQNHALFVAFCNQEKTMLNNQRRLGDRNPVDKRNLFHGTDSLDTVRGICINNFDFRLCGKNATKYGQGAYFARDAKYSHKFTKPSKTLNERYMFQANVLVGYYTKGNHEYKRPPGKPGKDHELYDSCVDHEDDPSIFILFEKNAYYPEYLIRYKYNGETDVSTPQPVMSINASHSTGSLQSSAAQQAPPPPPETTKKIP